jgi:hypothetical protein
MRAQVSCVTRLVHQKGIHLIKHAAWRTCERGGQFVLLGSAPDPKIQVRARMCGVRVGRGGGGGSAPDLLAVRLLSVFQT